LDSIYTQDDDRNPAWEDIDKDDNNIVEAEACWRANDIENREIVPDLEDMPKGSALAKAYTQVCNWILYTTVS
jgi:hypothetical protein